MFLVAQPLAWFDCNPCRPRQTGEMSRLQCVCRMVTSFVPPIFKVKHSLAIKLRKAVSCVLKHSMLIKIIQGRNAIGFFLAEQAGRFVNNHRIPVPRFSAQAKLCVLGIALAIGLPGCFGPSKVELMKQFDARIGQNKDRLITELGLPMRDCTSLQFGEACEWVQTGGRGGRRGGRLFLEGPLEGTFPGDRLTYFIDSKGIVCQWRFEGADNGIQQSTSQC